MLERERGEWVYASMEMVVFVDDRRCECLVNLFEF